MINKEELESEYFRSYSDLGLYSSIGGYHGPSSKSQREISFALHSPGGGVKGEIIMVWTELGGKQVPQLQSYDDSWTVLACFTDVIEKLSEYDNCNISPEKFMEILDSLGFINTNSYHGGYIPNEMFKLYQLERKRNKKIEEIL